MNMNIVVIVITVYVNPKIMKINILITTKFAKTLRCYILNSTF